MKRVLAFTLLWVLLAGPVAAHSPGNEKALADTAGTETQVVVQVDGLACPFCAYGLEKKLKSLPGVQKLEIRVNSGEVRLGFKNSVSVDVEAIANKVKEAGFTPRRITLNGEVVYPVQKEEAGARSGDQ